MNESNDPDDIEHQIKSAARAKPGWGWQTEATAFARLVLRERKRTTRLESALRRADALLAIGKSIDQEHEGVWSAARIALMKDVSRLLGDPPSSHPATVAGAISKMEGIR